MVPLKKLGPHFWIYFFSQKFEVKKLIYLMIRKYAQNIDQTIIRREKGKKRWGYEVDTSLGLL